MSDTQKTKSPFVNEAFPLTDAFALLEMPYTFELDLSLLDNHFFKAQRLFHPDRHAMKSFEEKEAARRHSAALNEAYERLRHPLKRALLLLDVKNMGLDLSQPLQDPKLLEKVFDLQEEKERLETLSDHQHFEEKLSHFFKDMLQKLHLSFKDLQVPHGSDEDILFQKRKNILEQTLLWGHFIEKMMSQLPSKKRKNI